MNMKRISYFWALSLILCGESSCTNSEELVADSQEAADLKLQIAPVLSDIYTTRSPQNDKILNDRTEFAISIFPSGKYDDALGIDGSDTYPPIPEYKRIDVTTTIKEKVPTYSYQPIGLSSSFPALYLKRKEGAVDVYVYHPYDAFHPTKRLEAIPFVLGDTVTTNYDYMIPKEGMQTVDPTADALKDLNACKLPVTFNHIMTQLEFRFTVSFWGQDLIPSITLNCIDKDSSTPVKKIAMKGSYSFTTGALVYDNDAMASEFTYKGIIIPVASGMGAGYTQGIVIPPIELKDADANIEMSVSIKFNKVNPQPVQETPYSFTLKSLKATDEEGNTRYGLLPGYKYIFNVTIDNFVKYNGVPTKVKWTDVPSEIPI